MKRTLTFLFTIIILHAHAQQDSVYQTSVRANVQGGLVIPEYGFISFLSNNFTHAAQVSFQFQSTGKNFWQQLYRYPSWGCSFYYTTMSNEQEFGDQFSLYPYYSLHLIRKNKFDLSYQMGIGASWATRKFDAVSNRENLAIGTHLNIHYHADLVTSFRVTERLYANAGISFSHISNANLGEPNVGLNIPGLYAGLSYGLGQKAALLHQQIPSFTPLLQYEVMVTGGVKHTRTFEAFSYPAGSVSFDVKYRKRYKFNWGAGADLFYDSSVEPQMKRLGKTFEPSDAWMTGLHVDEEFVYNRVSFILQEGVYLGLTEKLNGYVIYDRAIARYRFTSHLFATLSMKSHLYILDFPEAGIGCYW